MFSCDRCGIECDELWAGLEMFSRLGNSRSVELCQACSLVAYSFVLNRPLGVPMTIVWDMPLYDPEDVDDAEHHAQCHCAECDPDFRFEADREDRAWAS